MAGRWGAGVLVYSVIASLDGYTADAEGKFDWAEPDEEVLGYLNDLERGIGTYLYGRRMYETMVGWETVPLDQMDSPGSRDFAGIWRSADKIVYSTTLRAASSARTRIEPRFDPEAVRALKRGGDVSVGGPGLATSALRAGLVDEYQLFVTPVVVGGGTPVFPSGIRVRLDLVDQHRFASGVVYLRYRLRD
jgi:dihydrofolate reductase